MDPLQRSANEVLVNQCPRKPASITWDGSNSAVRPKRLHRTLDVFRFISKVNHLLLSLFWSEISAQILRPSLLLDVIGYDSGAC